MLLLLEVGLSLLIDLTVLLALSPEPSQYLHIKEIHLIQYCYRHFLLETVACGCVCWLVSETHFSYVYPLTWIEEVYEVE